MIEVGILTRFIVSKKEFVEFKKEVSELAKHLAEVEKRLDRLENNPVINEVLSLLVERE